VAITFRSSHAEADQTVRDIENLGRSSLAVECDVRSEASVGSAVTAVVGSFGRLDLVVNNAAVFESAPLDSLTLGQWNVVFETNARGPFLVAREALAHLRAVKAGSSTSVPRGNSCLGGHAHYCASKAALHMLHRHGQSLCPRGQRQLRCAGLD